MSIFYHETSQEFHLKNESVSYIMKVLKNGQIGQLYYGSAIPDKEDFGYYIETMHRPMSSYLFEGNLTYSLEHLKQEYPSYGTTDYREPAFEILQENGSRISDFVYESHKIYDGKPELQGLPAVYVEEKEEAQTLEIILRDSLTGAKMTLYYTIMRDFPVITRSMNLENDGDQSFDLTRAMSACLDLPDKDYEWIQLSGAWAREREIKTRKLEQGIQSVGSLRGNSSHNHNPFIALKRQSADEFQGDVIGMSLVYSGNFLMQAEVDTYDVTRILMGIHPMGFQWHLEPGESFQTPEAVITFSEDGLNGMSQTFHKLFRTRLARGYWRDKERPILINNWEATYFDFNEDTIVEIAKSAKKAGIEMFVLDDGWFGTRNDDKQGLGDWFANLNKLEHGISGLSKRIEEECGMKFGLWFEPEMVNENSDLFRKHPDYRIETPGRKCSHGRNEFVLDFSRKEVVDCIYDQMEKLLADSKVSYIKWDMNRSVDNVFSAALPKERQGEVYHRYVLAVYEMMESLVQRYPDLLFESCSGGGGRFEAGMLYYSPQIWCSDNTDAIDRLKIQYGTSFGYPISAMGAHVSVCPNHQSGRTTPFETRGIVASAGTFGYELDLMKMSEEEKKTAREQILKYKEMEHLVQSGDYYRLVNPFENNKHVLWQFVSKDKKETVVCGVRLHSEANPYIYLFYPQGLDADMKYEDTATGKVYTGAALMKAGLPLPLTTGDYQPIRFTFKAVEK